MKKTKIYIDRVIQVIEGCGWGCTKSEDGTNLTVVEQEYTFGRYCFEIPLDDEIPSHIFQHFRTFSTVTYMEEMESFIEAHPEMRENFSNRVSADLGSEAWNIKQLLRILMYTVNAVPKEDKPLRFWMRAGMSFMMTETEMETLTKLNSQEISSMFRSLIWGNQFSLDGDSYAENNLSWQTEDETWRHGEVNYDFTPKQMRPRMGTSISKRFWMRTGISMMLTTSEFAKVIRGGKKGEEVIRRKIDSEAFELDGESYSPAVTNKSENVWCHEEIIFDF